MRRTRIRTSCVRAHQFSDGGILNKIPANKIDPIGQAILNLYPHANVPNAVYPDPNFRAVTLSTTPAWQFDVKIDHQIAEQPQDRWPLQPRT